MRIRTTRTLLSRTSARTHGESSGDPDTTTTERDEAGPEPTAASRLGRRRQAGRTDPSPSRSVRIIPSRSAKSASSLFVVSFAESSHGVARLLGRRPGRRRRPWSALARDGACVLPSRAALRSFSRSLGESRLPVPCLGATSRAPGLKAPARPRPVMARILSSMRHLRHLLDHRGHRVELLDQARDVRRVDPAAGGDPPPPRDVDHVRVAALVRGHAVDDPLDPLDLAVGVDARRGCRPSGSGRGSSPSAP